MESESVTFTMTVDKAMRRRKEATEMTWADLLELGIQQAEKTRRQSPDAKRRDRK